MQFVNSKAFAQGLDETDPLRSFRSQFFFPKVRPDAEYLYLCGNSLGLQPRSTRTMINEELDDWAKYGVEGHVEAKRPWIAYHENLTKMMAKIVGAKPHEVVCMNSLTVNLHLMMVSFYRPEGKRRQILIEAGAFPSDQYAVASQVRFHGFDPNTDILELAPREGEDTLRTEDILSYINEHGEKVALIMLGGVNYLSGQAYDMVAITKKGHEKGCTVGFDLAHAAGNITLELHDWNVDFAVWCTYKYLNSGPGGVAAAFVHERNLDKDLPRFEGWWGHNKERRFKMEAEFDPIPFSVEAWQLSTPPIFLLASLRASLKLFDQAGMKSIRAKSKTLTSYLEFLVEDTFGSRDWIITPRAPSERGAQLSFRIPKDGHGVLEALRNRGVICDFREPNIIRAAPAPLYNSYPPVPA
ncbi:kynureninase [Kistimonas scapharcae]|uniref:Kynureninase n=1 Tax=Kistimonas scapharcae TaxID=1036133 RepID=A0ABP8V2S5_9GAMM